MVKHIVLFQLAPEMEAERKKNVMDAFKEGIEALPAKIPFIRKIEVGLNANPEEQFDIALYSRVRHDGRRKGLCGPSGSFGRSGFAEGLQKSRSCVDYECKA